MINLILTKTIDSKYIFEKAKENYKNSNGAAKQLFIVPDRIVVSYQMMALRELGIEGSTTLRVCSFRTLADIVLGKNVKHALNQQMETMLMRKVIEESKNQFQFYNKASKYPGFAQEAIRLITTLRTNRVEADTLQKMLEKLNKEETSKYSAKIKDIILLLDKYTKEVNNRVDYVRKLELLLDAIKLQFSIGKPEELKIDKTYFDLHGYEIYVSEFDNFSNIEMAIMELLFNCNLGKNYVAIPYSENDNSYIFPKDLLNKFGRFNGCSVEEKYKIEELSPKVYEELQADLFGYKALPTVEEIATKPKTDVFKVQVAVNRESEVIAIASQIKALIRNGYRYKDIACVCCDPNTYKGIIDSVFSKYGIPYFADTKEALINQNITKILLYALKVKIDNDYSQADVFALLKELGNVVAKRNEINEFENYCLANGIERENSFRQTIKDSAMEKVRATLMDNLDVLDLSKNTIGEIVESIKAFFKKIDAEKICKNLAEEQESQGMHIASSITNQSYDKLNEILDQFANGDLIGKCRVGVGGMAKGDLYKILVSTIQTVTITTIPMSIDCVYIGDLQKSRYEDKKRMFIFGANEGLFPQEIADNSLLSMQDLAFWANKDVNVYPTVKDINKDARLNALMVLLKATDGFVISYPLQDLDGELLQPAVVLKHLMAIAGQTEAYVYDALLKYKKTSDGKIIDKALLPKDIQLADFVGSKNNALEALITINNLLKNNQIDETPEINRIRDELKRMAISVEGDKVDDILLGDHEIDNDIKVSTDIFGESTSVSRLEAYFTCPFKHFLQYTLGIKDRDIFGIDVADMGNIIHNCLELYFKQDEAKYMKMTKDEIHAFVSKTVDDNIKDEKKGYGYLDDAKLKASVDDFIDETTQSIATLVDKMKDSKFRPVEIEVAFGIDETNTLEDWQKEDYTIPKYGPLVLNADGTAINLKGKVDRVDACDNDIAIIDYKSKARSSAKISIKDIVYGNKIQVIIYLDVMAKVLQKNPRGAFYLPLSARVSSDAKEDRIQYVGMVTDNQATLNNMDTRIYGECKKTIDKGADSAKELGKLYPIKVEKCKTKTEIQYSNSPGSKMLKDDDFKVLIKYVEDLSTKAANEIKSGYIRISPYSENEKESYKCKYCDYKMICNIQKHPERLRVCSSNGGKKDYADLLLKAINPNLKEQETKKEEE